MATWFSSTPQVIPYDNGIGNACGIHTYVCPDACYAAGCSKILSTLVGRVRQSIDTKRGLQVSMASAAILSCKLASISCMVYRQGVGADTVR